MEKSPISKRHVRSLRSRSQEASSMLVMLQTLNLVSHPTGTHHYASKHDLKDSVHAEVMAYCPVRDFYDFMVPNPTASQELLNLRRRDSPKPRNWSSYSPYRSEWRNRAVDLCATIFTWSIGFGFKLTCLPV